MYRVLRFMKHLSKKQWLDTIQINDWAVRKARYIKPKEYEYESEDYSVQILEPLNSKHGVTYFLKKQLEIPSEWGGEAVALIFEAGGEGLLSINGAPYHGLDRNHSYVPLQLMAVGSKPLLEIELYDPIPEPVDPLNAQSTIQPPIPGIRSKLVRVNRPLQSLLYSVETIHETAGLLPENDLKRLRLIDALYETMDAVEPYLEMRFTDAEWIRSMEQNLVDKVKGLMPNQSLNGIMHMVGQSHIDVAWLWPVRETVRKVSRTFSTMNTLMEEYPNFVFSQSQPQLYAFAKQHYPDLYQKIKARIAEGRWELVGGMWVEPDLNIPSGESLVRQILYGQLFYQEEFGKTSSIEWLPDTFGYCASLPQILKLAGVEYFMTTKLNWNDTNIFPYDLFHWVGIDGTSILSYLNHGLNEHTKPRDIHEHWQSYRQKGKHNEQMLLYGHGDGGGGVTREMIEYINRSSLMLDLPASHFSTAGKFFKQISEKKPKLPTWHGDLYLELHRGTYTTHARNKRYNRKAEVMYREAEIWSRFSLPHESHGGMPPGQEKLIEGWKLILLNQFHDIIPGTSIPEAYETSAREYDQVFRLGSKCLDQSLQALSSRVNTEGEGNPFVVFNSLGWERDEVISIHGNAELLGLTAYDEQGNRLASDTLTCPNASDEYILAVRVPAIPAFGYTTIWLRHANDTMAEEAMLYNELTYWETDKFLLEFNDLGEIKRWYDKDAGREMLKAGSKANEFQFYHDKPLYWDAWDIDPRYEEQRAAYVELLEKKVITKGKTRDIIRFRWKINQSYIDQDIIMYHHHKRVDFQTKVLWKEDHKLLKVAFPVDVVANKATFEIPFGSLERPTHRNTSWEQAQFEVCGHRWADLSEGNYGVSLLNDCKYGYDIKDSTIRLSLLRAPKWPDLTADQGNHEFAYSIYAHEQDWRNAHVVRRAAELNHPVITVKAAKDGDSGALPCKQSFVKLRSEHVLLDTIKLAENGDGTIFRFYESSGGREKVTIQLPAEAKRAYLVNLLEEAIEEISVLDGTVELAFKPYEIKTIKW